MGRESSDIGDDVVSPRTVLLYANWLITPATEAPVPPITFQMECVKCSMLNGTDDPGATSVPSENFADVQIWALRHSGRNRDHTDYREHVQRYWRTEMVDELTNREEPCAD